MDIDADRLVRDIEATARAGSSSDAPEAQGRTVLTGTDADERTRDYFIDCLREAELEVTVDGVGNIRGTWYPTGTSEDDSPIVAGSHLDSVPQGGMFDGPLGVYAALEAVRSIAESDRSPDRPIVVVSFTEEEGARFPPLLGSSVAAGERDLQEARALEDTDGVSLAQALESIGYDGEGRLEAETWAHWLEVHIEQGTRLVDAAVPAGVVTDITGMSQLDVRFDGESNHAGTTPMEERSDTLAAAGSLVSSVEEKALALQTESESLVGTVGRIETDPNVSNVIPGRTAVSVDIRDVTRSTMDTLQEYVRTRAEEIANDRGLDVSVSTAFDIDPTPLDESVGETIYRGAERADVELLELHSGAGHDTMQIAGATSAGMIFAPSEDGISHSPQEWTDWEDCVAVTELLAETILELS